MTENIKIDENWVLEERVMATFYHIWNRLGLTQWLQKHASYPEQIVLPRVVGSESTHNLVWFKVGFRTPIKIPKNILSLLRKSLISVGLTPIGGVMIPKTVRLYYAYRKTKFIKIYNYILLLELDLRRP